MAKRRTKRPLPTRLSAAQKVAQVALGAGAFTSALAGSPELIVTLEDLFPPGVVEGETDLTALHQPGDDWKPPLTVFQRQALLLLDRLTGTSGIGVDWSRVDPASISVPPSDFHFRSGTVLEALNEYMLWTGLLVSEGRVGKLYALNPNVYESNRLPWRAVFNLKGMSSQLLVQGASEGWHPAMVSGFSYESLDHVSIETPLEHIDYEHLFNVSGFLLELEIGDVVDFSGSNVEGRPTLAGHYQMTGKEFNFRGPANPLGEQHLQTLHFTSARRMQEMLGHRGASADAQPHA